MRFRPALVGILSTAASVGCATIGNPSDPPPPGVFSVEVAAPTAGARWTMRETRHDNYTGSARTFTLKWTALGEGVHDAKPVYKLSNGTNTHVFDRATGSWIAALGGNSEVRYAGDPHDGTLASPLWVGKSWTARYTSREPVTGLTTYDMTFIRKIVAYEDVQVPAGTFKAFRIETVESDERAAVRRLTYWYAPELRLIVKSTGERYAQERQAYAVRETSELVEYNASK